MLACQHSDSSPSRSLAEGVCNLREMLLRNAIPQVRTTIPQLP